MPRTPSDAPRVEADRRRADRADAETVRIVPAPRDGPFHRRLGRGRDGAGRIRLERVGPGQASTPMAGSPPGRSPAMRPSRRGSAACSPTATSISPCRARSPPRGTDALPRSNFIDDLVWTKLRKLGLLPSAPADDATLSPARLRGRDRPACLRRLRSASSSPTRRPASGRGWSIACWIGPNTPTTGRTSGSTCSVRIPTGWGSRPS